MRVVQLLRRQVLIGHDEADDRIRERVSGAGGRTSIHGPGGRSREPADIIAVHGIALYQLPIGLAGQRADHRAPDGVAATGSADAVAHPVDVQDPQGRHWFKIWTDRSGYGGRASDGVALDQVPGTAPSGHDDR